MERDVQKQLSHQVCHQKTASKTPETLHREGPRLEDIFLNYTDIRTRISRVSVRHNVFTWKDTLYSTDLYKHRKSTNRPPFKPKAGAVGKRLSETFHGKPTRVKQTRTLVLFHINKILRSIPGDMSKHKPRHI